MKVTRNLIADYLNTGTSASPVYSLMGAGFNSLDENPNAQTDKKTYINESTSSTTIKSYDTQFPFDTDFIKDELAVEKLVSIGRNHATGSSAETEYVRVDLYDEVAATSNTYKARKFKVAIEVSNINGAGGEVVTVTGNLNAIGDPVQGTFDTSTKTFTAE